jgi:hypothetical protein
MCDYSLHHVANRPAKIGDKLVATKFNNSILADSRRSGSRTLRSACCLVPRSHSTRMSNVSRRSASVFCRTRKSGSGSRASGKSIWTTPWPITMRWNFLTGRWY